MANGTFAWTAANVEAFKADKQKDLDASTLNAPTLVMGQVQDWLKPNDLMCEDMPLQDIASSPGGSIRNDFNSPHDKTLRRSCAVVNLSLESSPTIERVLKKRSDVVEPKGAGDAGGVEAPVGEVPTEKAGLVGNGIGKEVMASPPELATPKAQKAKRPRKPKGSRKAKAKGSPKAKAKGASKAKGAPKAKATAKAKAKSKSNDKKVGSRKWPL